MLKVSTIEPWDGSRNDKLQYQTVTIWCWVAPSTPPTIKVGDGAGNYITQAATYDPGDGTPFTLKTTITGVGRYTIQGNAYLYLSGLTTGDGKYSIQGTQ